MERNLGQSSISNSWDFVIALEDHLLKIVKEFRETVKLKHLYRNKSHKAYFAHDAAYSDSKDLANRTISDKFRKIELMKMLE